MNVLWALLACLPFVVLGCYGVGSQIIGDDDTFFMTTFIGFVAACALLIICGLFYWGAYTLTHG